MKVTNIRMTQKVKRDARRLARANGKSLSEYIRSLIARELKLDTALRSDGANGRAKERP